MRVVIQRALNARVVINGTETREIGEGLVVLLGIEDSDTGEDIDWLTAKIVNLRVFNDEDGVMNISVKDKGGDVILVSQFTLHASRKKGTGLPTFVLPNLKRQFHIWTVY
jgi:D-tyrosyl-tRNA(Tyr) deacylase